MSRVSSRGPERRSLQGPCAVGARRRVRTAASAFLAPKINVEFLFAPKNPCRISFGAKIHVEFLLALKTPCQISFDEFITVPSQK